MIQIQHINRYPHLKPFIWHIKNDSPISDADKAFIEIFNPAIYCNDLTGTLWAFDQKLPSGKWLENIEFSGDLTSATAYIA